MGRIHAGPERVRGRPVKAQYIIRGDKIVNPFLGDVFTVTERSWEDTSQGRFFLLVGVKDDGTEHRLSLIEDEEAEVVAKAPPVVNL